MYSIAFPNFLTSNGVSIIKDKEATLSNMNLLLSSWKTSLFGDPYFGTNLKRFIFEQNNTVLQDLIIDDIFVSLQEFMPQVGLKRKDISVSSDGTDIYANINCINKLDKELNLYTIKLTSN